MFLNSLNYKDEHGLLIDERTKIAPFYTNFVPQILMK